RSFHRYSNSHRARGGVHPGHPAGDGDMGLRSRRYRTKREKHMKRARRSPVLGAVAVCLAAVVAAAANTLKCPPDSVKVGNASASCSSGGRRSRTTPSPLFSFAAALIVWRLVGWDRL